MAAFNASSESQTSWHLQSRARVSVPLQTPSAQSADLMSTTGFKGWMDTPPVGTHDPFIADQVKRGRRVLTGPSSSPAPEPYGGGKRIVGPHFSYGMPAGKRAFPEVVGKHSTDTLAPRGVRRVEARARGSPHPALSDPNSAVKTTNFKPESVKMYDGFNQVNYHCWVPGELQHAEKGDWNWNNQLGFRKVSMNGEGQPKRSLENPVAWPTYEGYPPSHSSATGQPIDYGLKLNGRQGGFTLKTQHPDVLESRANRAAASNTRIGGPVSSQPRISYVRGSY